MPLTITMKQLQNVCSSFGCPNLVALLFIPREIKGGISSAGRGGEKKKGNEKATLIPMKSCHLPTKLAELFLCLPLGPWPLYSHVLDQRVPGFSNNRGPDC